MAQTEADTNAIPDGKRAVSFAFLKGGSTKTTLAVNTARHLAEQTGEGDVLLLDLDTNGHATRHYDHGHDGLWSNSTQLGDVLIEPDDSPDPEDIIYESQFGFDILPSSNAHSQVEMRLQGQIGGEQLLRNYLIEPLLQRKYSYIIIDQPSNKGTMNFAGLIGSQNLILPFLPAGETLKSWSRTYSQLVERPQVNGAVDNVNVLAITPNLLGKRIDIQTEDRTLLEALNTQDAFDGLLPSYAQVTPEEWEKIDNGEMTPPKPGIRATTNITKGVRDEGLPLLDYAPEDSQNENFAELAQIIRNGGVEDA